MLRGGSGYFRRWHHRVTMDGVLDLLGYPGPSEWPNTLVIQNYNCSSTDWEIFSRGYIRHLRTFRCKLVSKWCRNYTKDQALQSYCSNTKLKIIKTQKKASTEILHTMRLDASILVYKSRFASLWEKKHIAHCNTLLYILNYTDRLLWQETKCDKRWPRNIKGHNEGFPFIALAWQALKLLQSKAHTVTEIWCEGSPAWGKPPVIYIPDI